MRSLNLALLALSVAGAIGCNRDPRLVSVTPKTVCANNAATLTLMGHELDARSVSIGGVNAAAVTGSGDTVSAMFTAGALTAADAPQDLVYTDKNGKEITLPAAVTV